MPIAESTILEGKQARKYIRAGSIVYPSMFEDIPVISPGDKVNIVIEKGLLKISAEGIARQRGAKGDIIKVANFDSKKIIEAEIIDSLTVAVR